MSNLALPASKNNYRCPDSNGKKQRNFPPSVVTFGSKRSCLLDIILTFLVVVVINDRFLLHQRVKNTLFSRKKSCIQAKIERLAVFKGVAAGIHRSLVEVRYKVSQVEATKYKHEDNNDRFLCDTSC